MPVPIVSVIIPTYNSSGALRQSVESVLLQDMDDLELWVIGDGCTDDSREVVEGFGDARVFWHNLPRNSGGPSAPRNEGLRRAAGQFIAYLGHDDLWFPWHLSTLLHLLRETDADFAFSMGLAVFPGERLQPYGSSPDRWQRTPALSPSNWVHKADLTPRIGAWSPKLRLPHDREFLGRVLRSGVRLAQEPQVSVLVFPAAWWASYSIQADYPQQPYVATMRTDPHNLCLQMLNRVAEQCAQGEGPLPQGRGSIVHRTLRRLVEAYGLDRWPVTAIMHWRWRRRSGLASRRQVEGSGNGS